MYYFDLLRQGLFFKLCRNRVKLLYCGKVYSIANDFVMLYKPFGGSRDDVRYKLTDPFLMFYLNFVDGAKVTSDGYWSQFENTEGRGRPPRYAGRYADRQGGQGDRFVRDEIYRRRIFGGQGRRSGLEEQEAGVHG